jgi:hypothetical protein
MSSQNIAPLLITICLVTTLIAPCVAGDGVVMDYETIDLNHEKDQTAIIHLSGGYQRMVLSIDIDRSSRSVWLFPVPADPDKITLDHGIWGTTLSGDDILGTAKMELEQEKEDMIGFHIASIFPGFRTLLFWNGDFTDLAGGDAGPQIHHTLDKDGIHSEIVTTNTGSGLVEYLSEKGKDVPEILIPKIEHYSDLGYSFIVSWINTSTEGKRPGIAISFPRTELYYPMILTSGYGDINTPVNLIILDHVKVVNGGLGRISHKYFGSGRFEGQWEEGNRLYQFLDLQNWRSDFTTISINAKASAYKDDLVFENAGPQLKENMDWDHYFIIFIAVSLLVSIILGFLCSLIFFRKGDKELIIFGSMGFLNAIAIWIFMLGWLTAFAIVRKKPFRVIGFALLFQTTYLIYVLVFVKYILFTL